MADAPENLVLQLLRDIRANQGQDSQRLGELEKQVKSLNTKITYLMGLSTDADFKAQLAVDPSETVSERLDGVIARSEALEAR